MTLPATIFIKKLQVLLYVDCHKMLCVNNLAVQNIDILKNFIHNLLTFCEQENQSFSMQYCGISTQTLQEAVALSSGISMGV